MAQTASPAPSKHARFGPYSRALRRGVLRDNIDGRSTMGRFVRDLERQLLDHVGGRPTVTQRLLIERLVKTTAQLDALDRKLDEGTGWTDHDSRTHNGLVNRQRLLLRELGLEPRPAPTPTLADIEREIIARRISV